MDFRVDDRDLKAFIVYAERSLTLDASLRAALKRGPNPDHEKQIAALHELNKKELFRETRRDVRP